MQVLININNSKVSIKNHLLSLNNVNLNLINKKSSIYYIDIIVLLT